MKWLKFFRGSREDREKVYLGGQPALALAGRQPEVAASTVVPEAVRQVLVVESNPAEVDAMRAR